MLIYASIQCTKHFFDFITYYNFHEIKDVDKQRWPIWQAYTHFLKITVLCVHHAGRNIPRTLPNVAKINSKSNGLFHGIQPSKDFFLFSTFDFFGLINRHTKSFSLWRRQKFHRRSPLIKQLLTKYHFFKKLPQISHIRKNHIFFQV